MTVNRSINLFGRFMTLGGGGGQYRMHPAVLRLSNL